MKFSEILAIAAIGVVLLLAASFLPAGDDTHRNVVTTLQTVGSGFCGAAIGQWTGVRRGRRKVRETGAYETLEARKEPDAR